MTGTVLRALAVVLMAAPLAFGSLRLLTSGSDARYVWTALASFVGAAVLLYGPGSPRAPNAVRVVAAFLLASGCATVVAVILGASSGPAIAVVAAGFAFCSAGGLSLFRRSQVGPPSSPSR